MKTRLCCNRLAWNKKAISFYKDLFHFDLQAAQYQTIESLRTVKGIQVADIQSLQQQVSSLNASSQSLRSQIATLQSQLSTLSSRLSELLGELSTLDEHRSRLASEALGLAEHAENARRGAVLLGGEQDNVILQSVSDLMVKYVQGTLLPDISDANADAASSIASASDQVQLEIDGIRSRILASQSSIDSCRSQIGRNEAQAAGLRNAIVAAQLEG